MKNKRNQQGNQENTKKDDVLEFQGIVEEALPSALFRVKCESGLSIICTISGKLRINHIRILPGDSVIVQMSPYDTTHGRISWRAR